MFTFDAYGCSRLMRTGVHVACVWVFIFDANTHKPKSLTELEQLSHRKKSNLSRTLKTLENYGIVSLSKENGKVIPTVKASSFKVEFGVNSADYD